MKNKKIRKLHTEEFKKEAVQLASKIGVTAAANQLGIYGSQIYSWRSRVKKQATTSQREAELAAEVAKLKRQLAG